MQFLQGLAAVQRRHDSLLCVGLDPEPERFPGAWRGDAARIFDFCARIVDATKDLVCAYKPQIAYFAAHRAEGQLEQLMAYIRRVAPEVPVILDAKRGDIGSTAAQYAREAFVRYQADAVTLSPYMGLDSIEPYLAYDGRGLILLCRTSNAGGSDLQQQTLASGESLYEYVAKLAAGPWNQSGRLGLVVGATFPADLARVRELAPRLLLLVPGIGAQGGDARATVTAAWRPDAPIVVSSSRAVLYAGSGEGFAAAARDAARATRDVLAAARRDADPQSAPQ
jgi:orotidine-5'-phosphate decarboxylase